MSCRVGFGVARACARALARPRLYLVLERSRVFGRPRGAFHRSPAARDGTMTAVRVLMLSLLHMDIAIALPAWRSRPSRAVPLLAIFGAGGGCGRQGMGQGNMAAEG